MPAEGTPHAPRAELLTFEEIERLMRLFASVGVQRIRLTGGEPTLRMDLPALVARLNAIDGIDEVVMTTNAFLLERQAQALKDAGLRSLNVSLDTLRPERFREITRIGSLERVLRGIDAARRVGFNDIKLNCVAVRGFNDDELLDLVEWSIDQGLTLRFIEFMPIGGADTIWGTRGCLPAAEMRSVLSSCYQITPEPSARGVRGPAGYWRLLGPRTPTGGAKVGFISAVTECFCDACNRLRLTAEGGLRACLADDREFDLRALLRGGVDDEWILSAIKRTLWGKEATHSFSLSGEGSTQRIMSTIGG